ncbi:hypothetical protein K488DRAFT_82492 [Vararia minispora EC-137]|uniref:Uncharacterized protein n=1 Tax=Vararia minispora EC-137 TaxID=1314806 RepID=A0ACB8QW12_9AGAM|nr:hypothetical protein K488DRAFT_82492 [Vararia minispora EC-137]
MAPVQLKVNQQELVGLQQEIDQIYLEILLEGKQILLEQLGLAEDMPRKLADAEQRAATAMAEAETARKEAINQAEHAAEMTQRAKQLKLENAQLREEIKMKGDESENIRRVNTLSIEVRSLRVERDQLAARLATATEEHGEEHIVVSSTDSQVTALRAERDRLLAENRRLKERLTDVRAAQNFMRDITMEDPGASVDAIARESFKFLGQALEKIAPTRDSVMLSLQDVAPLSMPSSPVPTLKKVDSRRDINWSFKRHLSPANKSEADPQSSDCQSASAMDIET